MNPLHIIEGHAFKLLHKVNLLPEDIKELSEARMLICQGCHDNGGPGLKDGKYCNSARGGCGCDMEAKTKVQNAKCPHSKW